jgi:pilus assembly protein CpaD
MRSDRIYRCRLKGLSRSASGVYLAAILVAVGGCARVENVEVGAIPDDYRTNHPIVVSEQEYAINVAAARDDRTLTLGSRDAVRGFADTYRESASGTVNIMTPIGSPNVAAASRVAGQIRTELINQGIPEDRIAMVSYQAASTGDAAPIRLSYYGIRASTGPCGRWPKDLVLNTADNKHYENFGCATQNNLAAQIADPSDLLAPRGMTPIDAERRDVVLRNYREYGASASDNE